MEIHDVTSQLLDEFFRRAAELNIVIPEEYSSVHMPAKLKKLLSNRGSVLVDEFFNNPNDWRDEHPSNLWAGSFHGTPLHSTLNITRDQSTSFVQWPPDIRKWQVRLDITEMEAWDKIGRPLEHSRWSFELTSTYKGMLQDPPSEEPCLKKFILTKEGNLFLRHTVHYAAGSAWNPDPGTPAEQIYSEGRALEKYTNWKSGRPLKKNTQLAGTPYRNQARHL